MVNNTVLDEVFGVLSANSRRLMIAELRSGPKILTELADAVSISLPAAHKNILIMQKAGLVDRHKYGRESRISLRPDALSSAIEWLDYYNTYWNDKLDQLETYVTRRNGEL
jgi:predicted transcriptional regulator